MAPYQYSRLHGNSTIRLLELDAGAEGTPITCRLITSSLDEQPIFEALSYAWGDLTMKVPISCQGQLISVTQNCYQALKGLREPGRPRMLWVDAICINQSSIPERNEQVSLMARIYTQTKRVLIWLGEEADQSDRALELLLLLRDVRLKHEREILLSMMKREFIGKSGNEEDHMENYKRQLERQTSEKLTQDGLILDAYKAREGLPGFADPKWKTLTAFFRRAWFSRVWVFQEVVLSKRAVLHCGKKSIDWETLGFAVECLMQTLLPTSPVAGSGEVDVLLMNRTRQQVKKAGYIDLLEILGILKDYNCTDPRDRVYGVLGLTRGPSGPWINVDYALSIEEIFHRVAVAFLTNDANGIDLLTFAQQPRKLPGLPSWVPDWTSTLPGKYLGLPTWFRASGRTGTIPKPFTLKANDKILTLSVLLVDKIAQLASPMPHESKGTGLASPYQTVETFFEWQKLALSQSFALRVYNDQSTTEAFWRTLVADLGVPMSTRADPSMEYNYKHLYSKFRMARRGFFDSDAIPDAEKKYRSGLGLVYGMLDPDFKAFYHATVYSWSYRFGILEKLRWFCLVPQHSDVGDKICVIKGLNVPFVIRQEEESKPKPHRLTIVGPCYVHGLMDGALAEEGYRRGKFESATFK